MQLHVIIVGAGPGEPGGIGKAMDYLSSCFPSENTPRVTFLNTTDMGRGTFKRAILVAVRLTLQLLQNRASGTTTVVHMNVSSSGSTLRKFVMSRICLAFGVPYICHLHSGRYPLFYKRANRVVRSCVRSLFRRSQRVIVLGKTWQQFVCSSFGLSEAGTVILPNATPAPPDAPLEGRSSRVSPSSPPTVLYVGRISQEKGVEELLDACAILEQRMSFQLRLVGDCRDEELRQRIQGLAPTVAWAGWLEGEELWASMRAASIFVLPSHDEGLPMSLLEAMSLGLPIVATPVGAIPESVHHMQEALIVPVDDKESLSDALATLLSDSRLRESLGNNAQKTWESKFTLERFAANLSEIWLRAS